MRIVNISDIDRIVRNTLMWYKPTKVHHTLLVASEIFKRTQYLLISERRLSTIVCEEIDRFYS